jgi:hypothetical protein
MRKVNYMGDRSKCHQNYRATSMALLMKLKGIQDQTIKLRNTKKEIAMEHIIAKMSSQETSKS